MTDATQADDGTGGRILLILPRMHGFFSLFFEAIGQAYLAQKAGMTPVVYYNRHSPYWSDAGYNGERNLWNYFFEPLSSQRIEKLFPGVPLEALEGYDFKQFQNLCQGTQITPVEHYPEDVIEYKSPFAVWSQREFVHNLVSRYAILKPAIREKVEAYERDYFASHKIIGVHYRGLEKSQGQTRDGVVAIRKIDMQNYFLDEVRSRLRKFPSARVFVATDSAEFLAEARRRFGSAVLNREATRLSKEEEILGLHFKQHAEQVKPLLAEEVLLDVLLLARTSFLVHGVSGVANAALGFNPALPHFDVEVRHGKTSFYVLKELIRQISRVAPLAVAMLQKVSRRRQQRYRPRI